MVENIANVGGRVLVKYSDGHAEVVFSGLYMQALEYQRKMFKSIKRRPDIVECKVVAD